jgi:hypothetical protein
LPRGGFGGRVCTNSKNADEIDKILNEAVHRLASHRLMNDFNSAPLDAGVTVILQNPQQLQLVNRRQSGIRQR